MSDKCPKGKLLNPKTGRCVNKDGKIGQELLAKGGAKPKEVKVKDALKNAKPKDCPSHQLRNPKTGRCVNKDGKIGQELLAKGGAKPKEVKPKEDKKLTPDEEWAMEPGNYRTGVPKKEDMRRRKSMINKLHKVWDELNPLQKENYKLMGKEQVWLDVKIRDEKNTLHKQKFHPDTWTDPPEYMKAKDLEKTLIKLEKDLKNAKKEAKALKKKADCPSHQVRNPKTGRCVNKAGKIGQEILLKNGKVAKPVGPGVPDNFVNLPDDCEINKVWKQKDELGRGQYGVAYLACKSEDDCNYVLKVQKLDDDFYTEVRCLEDFKNTKGIVPKLYAAWTCDNRGYFVIEKLDKCPADKTVNSEKNYEEVSKLLHRMKEKGWLHVDTHPGNVMCKNGKMIMIDFGWAVKKGKKNYPDNPVSKRIGKPVTWENLEVVQELNVEKYFGVDDIKYNRLVEEAMKLRAA